MKNQLKSGNLKENLARATIFFLLILVVIIIFRFANEGKDRRDVITYHQSSWNQYAPEVERAMRGELRIEELKLRHIYGGVVPHHIPTTISKLVLFYSRLKEKQIVKNFIIIGPDHTDAGKAPITASNASFFTFFSQLKPIEGLASKLQEKKLVNIEEAPFTPEHSIGAQILIISKIFPDARVTPIILRSNTPQNHAETLGKFLANFLDEETVLIASVDFSHYLSTEQAMTLDSLSGEVLRNLDTDSISLIKADSNKSMVVFMEAMNSKKAVETADISILNTNDLMENSDYTTGYVFGFWGVK